MNFITLAVRNNINTAKYFHLFEFLPFIHLLVMEKKHEGLLAVEKLLYKCGNAYLLRGLLMDLFSKDVKERLNAAKFLTKPLLLQEIFSNMDQQSRWATQYIESKGSDIVGEIEDPLRNFLDNENRSLIYKEETLLDTNELFVDTNDLYNLLYVASDENIEITLRISSLEQINEFLVMLLKSPMTYSTYILELFTFAIQKLPSLHGSFMNNSFGNEALLAAKLLSIINKIMEAENLPDEVRDCLKISMKIEKILPLICLILPLIQCKSNHIRFQILLFLNNLVFNISSSLYDKNQDQLTLLTTTSSSFGTKFLQTTSFLSRKYFIVGKFENYQHNSSFKSLWSLYPFEGHFKYFIEMHLDYVKSGSKNINSLQDIILEEKLSQFMKFIRNEQDPFNALNRWVKLILVLEKCYIPRVCFEEFDLWAILIKVVSNNLRGAITFCGPVIKNLLYSDIFKKEVLTNPELINSMTTFLDFLSHSIVPALLEVDYL